ncbi:MAG: WG repeat-containing protein [Ignavibacteriaceae bacterium]|nr:WG repeat-containing protein [Ignavibacteriaceae bacterium]
MRNFVGILFFLFFSVSALSQTLTAIEVNNRWGFKDERGNIVIPPVYLFAYDFNKSGTTAVFTDSGWVYINQKGKPLFSVLAIDNGPDYFSGGLARFVDDKKIGYFNETGQIVIYPMFDFAFPFENGTALVCNDCIQVQNGEHYFTLGGNWMRIDSTGSVIQKLSQEESSNINAAPVTLNGELIWIDQSGKRIK